MKPKDGQTQKLTNFKDHPLYVNDISMYLLYNISIYCGKDDTGCPKIIMH